MSRPLRFLTYLAPNMLPVYEHIVAEIGRQLGRPTEILVGEDYAEALSERTDLSFICGLPYVELTQDEPGALEPLAAPILAGERFQDRPIYFSDVIVSDESAFTSFADLRGARWAYNEPHSQSGYGIVRQRLLQMGETKGFFGEVIESGFHQKSILMVARGKVDASAIDCQVLQVALQERPDLRRRLRVIDELGPSTIQPLVASAHVPRQLQAQIRGIVQALHHRSESARVLAHGQINRYVGVDRSSYEDIRGMVEHAQAAGFVTLR